VEHRQQEVVASGRGKETRVKAVKKEAPFMRSFRTQLALKQSGRRAARWEGETKTKISGRDPVENSRPRSPEVAVSEPSKVRCDGRQVLQKLRAKHLLSADRLDAPRRGFKTFSVVVDLFLLYWNAKTFHTALVAT